MGKVHRLFVYDIINIRTNINANKKNTKENNVIFIRKTLKKIKPSQSGYTVIETVLIPCWW